MIAQALSSVTYSGRFSFAIDCEIPVFIALARSFHFAYKLTAGSEVSAKITVKLVELSPSAVIHDRFTM